MNVQPFSPEAQKNIDEITSAFKAFNKLTELVKFGAPPVSRQQQLKKKAKERRAKRKRGGHK